MSHVEFAQWLADAAEQPGGLAAIKEEGQDIVFPHGGRVRGDLPITLVLLDKKEKASTAETFLFCLMTLNLSNGDYVRLAKNRGLKFVSVLDRPVISSKIKDIKSLFATAEPKDSAPAKAQPLVAVQEEQKPKQTMQAALDREICYHNRNTCLHAARTFSDVLELDKTSKDFEDEKSSKNNKAKRIRRTGNPIIVVPALITGAPINLCNVKKFLEDGVFAYAPPSQQILPQSINIMNTHPQWGTVTYRVVDSTAGFTEEEYNRVVAMFISGQRWQLNQIALWNDPSVIFSHIRGIYVYFDDAKKSEVATSWNVADFPIKRQSRNKDSVQAHGIWTAIYEHMQKKHALTVESLIQDHAAKMLAEREARLKGMQALLDDDETAPIGNGDRVGGDGGGGDPMDGVGSQT